MLELLCELPPSQRTQDQARALARSCWPEGEADPDYQALALDEQAARQFRWDGWLAITGLWKLEDPATVEDAVTIFNYGNVQLTFRIYGTDARNNEDGQFDLLPGDDTPTAAGPSSAPISSPIPSSAMSLSAAAGSSSAPSGDSAGGVSPPQATARARAGTTLNNLRTNICMPPK